MALPSGSASVALRRRDPAANGELAVEVTAVVVAARGCKPAPSVPGMSPATQPSGLGNTKWMTYVRRAPRFTHGSPARKRSSTMSSITRARTLAAADLVAVDRRDHEQLLLRPLRLASRRSSARRRPGGRPATCRPSSISSLRDAGTRAARARTWNSSKRRNANESRPSGNTRSPGVTSDAAHFTGDAPAGAASINESTSPNTIRRMGGMLRRCVVCRSQFGR